MTKLLIQAVAQKTRYRLVAYWPLFDCLIFMVDNFHSKSLGYKL